MAAAKVTGRLEKFFENISLDESRRRRIDAALNNLQAWIQRTPMQRLLVAEMFPQGSFAHQTVVRPLSPREEYDVDVVLPIDADRHREGYQGAEEILRYVRNSLAKYPDYQGKLQQRRCCVRIGFAAGFHVDIVPAHVTGENPPYQVPNRLSGDWEPSNPSGYNQWIEKVNGGPSRFYMRQATKAFKRWRDVKFAKKRAPKSIVLTTLLGYNNPGQTSQDDVDFRLRFPEEPSVFAYLVDAAAIMHANLSEESRPPELWNPSLPPGDENFARNWDRDDFELFVARLGVFADRLRKAYRTKDSSRGIQLLGSQFGDAFPAS